MDSSRERDLSGRESGQSHSETTFTGTNLPNLDWRFCLSFLARKWRQAELVLFQCYPAHGKMLASSREPSGASPIEPDLNRIEAAAECWKKDPNSQRCLVSTIRALIDAITDVEHTAAAIGDMIIFCTQCATLIGKTGILHILSALGKALNCADHGTDDTGCDGLSGVEQAVRNFETERYLGDDWERDEALLAITRRVKDILECAQSGILFSDIVAGCRAQCTDYRQARWVVARAMTESSIPVSGDITSTSLILAMRRSRFGICGLTSSSSGIQGHVTIDVPLIGDQTTLIPWMQVTDTGQMLCRSRIGGWYVKWSQTVMHQSWLYPEFSYVSQEEAAAVNTSNRTLIRYTPTYVRTRRSLSVDFVRMIGWLVLDAPRLLEELYRDAAEGSDIPDPNRLGVDVMDRLREWNLYEGLVEQCVTERSLGYLAINTKDVHEWARGVVMRCLRSIQGASVALVSSNGKVIHCAGGGSPMVDEQEKLHGSGFFLQREQRDPATRLSTKQGILEAVAPQSSPDEIRYLLTGIQAVCDQMCGYLNISPDFSALQDLGDFSYRRNIPLQLVPGAYSSRRGRLEEEEAIDLRRNWRWASMPDTYLAVDHVETSVE